MSQDESLDETAYLLESPENARRLLAAIDRLEYGPRPRIGGYRSNEPLTAGGIDEELANGFDSADHP